MSKYHFLYSKILKIYFIQMHERNKEIKFRLLIIKYVNKKANDLFLIFDTIIIKRIFDIFFNLSI